MKTLIWSLLFSLLTPVFAVASPEAGPRGGKLLGNSEPRAEVLIEQNRTMSVAFYDAQKRQVAPAEQVVAAIAEAPGAKTRIEFEKKDLFLVSKSPLPPGKDYNIVLQLKQNAEAKPENFRVKYNIHICGECGNPEYACTCAH